MNSPLAFVIEDDKNLSIAYTEAIEEAGFESQSFRDGREGLDSLKTSTPDMVILDLNLPGVNGLEIIKYIRADERLKNTRVIITTADDRTAETLHGKADLVLVKPVGYGQLRDMAARLQKRYRNG